MTAPMAGLPLSTSPPHELSKRRVLLVDTSAKTRDLRAEAMRRLGMEVDCAADIGEARSWWRADLYHLVLIDMGNGLGYRDKFCEDLRQAAPPQHYAFLVGKPEYLSDSPNGEGEASGEKDGHQVLQDEAKAILSAESSGVPGQRWGILEASQRISAVRSASLARTRAMREKPTPPRDLEMRDMKRSAAWSQVLPELRKEELE